MDVRIGLIQTAKELEVELDDDADAGALAQAGRRRARRTAARCGSPTARAARSACRPRSSPTSRSAAPTTTAASASGAEGRSDAVDLLDRRLLFVTGKGGVGKTTIAASLALLAAAARQAHARRRGRRQGQPGRLLRDRAHRRSRSARWRPGLFAMSMDTEESLKEYLSLQLKIPLVARLGPLARTFDFVANAAPGVKEILTDRQVPVGGARATATTSSWSTPSPPATSSASSPPRRRSRSSCRSGWCATRPAGCSTSSATPTQTGVVIVAAPEEMPVNETLELADRLADGDRRRPRRRRRQPGAARAVRPGRGGGVRAARARRATRRRLSEALGASVRPILDGAQLAVTLRRTRAAHLARLREELPAGHAAALRARTCSSAATASGPPARSPSTSARSSGF